MGLSCMNCKQNVEQDKAKIFAQVFLCPTCNMMAERFYAQANHKITALLVGLKERMREALSEGQAVQFSDSEPSKKDVLEAILKLQETSDARKLATRNNATARPRT